jgi:hypothetical protein
MTLILQLFAPVTGNEKYTLTHTATGWTFVYHRHRVKGQDVQRDGTAPEGSNRSSTTNLYGAFLNGGVSYPEGLPDRLEALWEAIGEGRVDQEKAQRALNRLGEWIQACTNTQPPDDFIESS